MSSGALDPALLLVRREIVIEVDQTTAFSVFTERLGQWWPLSTHHIGTRPPETAILEPFAGGRWFERSMDGTECDWGKVLVWEPPRRLLLSWDIGCQWSHDESVSTEVEVIFIAEGTDRTKVVLEHRKLEQYGDAAERMRDIFGSDRGWTGILRCYASAVRL